MIERHSPALSLSRQCALLGLSRSSLYYEPALPDVATLQLLRLIDQQYSENAVLRLATDDGVAAFAGTCREPRSRAA